MTQTLGQLTTDDFEDEMVDTAEGLGWSALSSSGNATARTVEKLEKENVVLSMSKAPRSALSSEGRCLVEGAVPSQARNRFLEICQPACQRTVP